MAIVKKITTKAVCGGLTKRDIPDEGEYKPLMKVYGQARRAQAMPPTDYGPYIRFKGSFGAVNVATGEEFKAPNLILPEVAADILEDALSVEGTTAVDFALEVGVVGDDSGIGYHYTAESMLNQESDPLEMLRGELVGQGLLPAPPADAGDDDAGEAPKAPAKKTAAKK